MERITIRKTTKGYVVSSNGKPITSVGSRFEAERIANQRRKWKKDWRHKRNRKGIY